MRRVLKAEELGLPTGDLSTIDDSMDSVQQDGRFAGPRRPGKGAYLPLKTGWRFSWKELVASAQSSEAIRWPWAAAI